MKFLLKRIPVCLLFAALFAVGCLKEDRSACRAELRLRFRYMLNLQDRDLFAREVGRITVFIFNEQGRYVGTYGSGTEQLTDNYVLGIQLPVGEYTVVAWGGNTDGYILGRLVDPATQNVLPGLVEGVTTLEEFYLRIPYAAAGAPPYWVEGPPAPLYHGLLTEVEVRSVEAPTEAVIDLMKDTNTLRISIVGLENAAGDVILPEIYFSASNGCYDFRNTISDGAQLLGYSYGQFLIDGNLFQTDVVTLRLMLSPPFREPGRLVVRDPATGHTLYDKNLIEELLRVRDPEGNLLFRTQRDLDRCDLYDIRLEVNNNLQVTVMINGWTVTDMQPEL